VGRLDIRFGDYSLGGGRDFNSFFLPMSVIDSYASKNELWKVSNEVAWDALTNYSKNVTNGVGKRPDQKRDQFIYFSKERPHIFLDKPKSININLDDFIKDLEHVSNSLNSEQLYDFSFTFDANRIDKYLINSENSKIFTSFLRYSLNIHVSTINKKGILIPNSKPLFWFDNSEQPSQDQIYAEAKHLIEELFEMANAKFLNPTTTYPAILDRINHGVFWHEAVGHGSEADRFEEDPDDFDDSDGDEDLIDDSDSSSFFVKRIGSLVTPEFISLYDDPTIEGHDGSYIYDDEGVLGQKVTLIKDGRLKGYLHSRESAGKFKTMSNGHGRNSRLRFPRSRMSNLIVQSSNEVSYDILKENLVKIIVDDKADYGLILEGSLGGFTLPEASYFNTTPRRVYVVNRKGKMTRAQGIYVAGTPRTAIRNIVQTSDNYAWTSGTCGSGSGWIPTAQYAPDALFRKIEIGKILKSNYEVAPISVIQKPTFTRP